MMSDVKKIKKKNKKVKFWVFGYDARCKKIKNKKVKPQILGFWNMKK